MPAEWFDAGLTALNVSVDSLDPRQFHPDHRREQAGGGDGGDRRRPECRFRSVKINAVLLKGLNDHPARDIPRLDPDKPIELRFIELMQTGEMDALFRDHHTSGELIKQRLQEAAGYGSCAAWMMALPRCSRIRTRGAGWGSSCPTAGFLRRLQPAAGLLKGKLHLCLFGDNGVELRDLLTDDSQQEALQWRIRQALTSKAATHRLHEGNAGMTPTWPPSAADSRRAPQITFD